MSDTLINDKSLLVSWGECQFILHFDFLLKNCKAQHNGKANPQANILYDNSLPWRPTKFTAVNKLWKLVKKENELSSEIS